MKQAINIFISLADADIIYYNKLQTHLSLLQRQHLINAYHSRQTLAGNNKFKDVEEHINSASIILLLISSDFMTSNDCYNHELPLIMQMNEKNKTSVVPILLRATDYTGTPFENLQVLLRNEKPITSWINQDEALAEIARETRMLVEKIIDANFDVNHARKLPVWNVPYFRSLFFTGREDILEQIYEGFSTNTKSICFQALCGLGGVGKTQIALEYAYRFHKEYNAILWIPSESHEALTSGLIAIAQILNLPEKDEQNQTILIQAVKNWLRTHDKCLLILDNCNELEIIKDYIPLTPLNNHVLLTTRKQATGHVARPIEVQELSIDLGALFLLRRAKVLDGDRALKYTSDREQILASTISQELGGLPLALDQAGAYIEATKCSLQEYINIYRIYKLDLLRERGVIADDHPDAVSTTWSLSFFKIEQTDPVAADLLRVCSFLYSGSISIEMLMDSAIHLGPLLMPIGANPLLFNKAIAALLSFSLVRRNNTKQTISIHRLVQAVMREGMGQQQKHMWLERLLKMLEDRLNAEASRWKLSEQLLPHLSEYINIVWESGEIWNDIFPDFPFLVQRTAGYLLNAARYCEAEPLYLMAALIWEQLLGEENFLLAKIFNSLANLYKEKGELEEAEIFYQSALSIWRKELESQDRELFIEDVAFTLNSVANFYRRQSNFEKAISFYEQAYTLLEQAPNIKLEDRIYPLVGLANIYILQDKQEEAEDVYSQLINVYGQQSNTDQSDLAHCLMGLANLYQLQNKSEEAEELYIKALHIREEVLGMEHPQIASISNNLANLYYRLGKYDHAKNFYDRAINIYENIYGLEHLHVSAPLFGLARLYYQMENYEKAEALSLRALHIQEQVLGQESSELVLTLVLLSGLYEKEGKHTEAEEFKKRYKFILEQQKNERSSKDRSYFY